MRNATLFNEATNRGAFDVACFHCIWFRRCKRSLTTDESVAEGIPALNHEVLRLAEEVVRAELTRLQTSTGCETARACALHRFSVEVLGTDNELTRGVSQLKTELTATNHRSKKRKPFRARRYNMSKKK